MRFLGRSLSGLFLLALTLGLLALGGQTVRSAFEARNAEERRERPARERVFTVNVVTGTSETIAPVLQAFGEVQAVRRLDVRVPVSGTVIELAPSFLEGGAITEGQLLLRVDPTDAEAALRRAETDLAETQADIRDATRSLELAREEIAAAENQAALHARTLARQQDLRARGVGSAAAVEAAELTVATAQQSILARRQAEASAEARLSQSTTALMRREINLEDARRAVVETSVYAPFDGTLSNVDVVQGGRVAANEQIATLVDATELEVAIRLSSGQHARLLDDSGRLKPAALTVSLNLLGVNTSTEGQLVREAPAVGEGETGRLLFASLSSAAGFRPGDFVEVSISEDALPNVTRLPATAVDAQSEVLVVGAEERLEELPVTVLRREGNDVLVAANAIEGRDIVVARTPLLGAGIKVRPLRPGSQEASAQPDTLKLDPDRRARLIAFVEGNTRMPGEARARMLDRLAKDDVPRAMVERIEARMGDST